MKRNRSVLTLLIGMLIGLGPVGNVSAESKIADDAMASVAAAENAVSQARAAIENGKELVALIPEDSPLLPEVSQMLQAASSNWKVAVNSLRGAKECVAKIESASTPALSDDFSLLAKVNGNVALSGANVVKISLAYVEAVANNKTESLDIIRGTMQDALAASSQVQMNCDKVKNLIDKKYSK
jgi:hypothetical protein